MDQKTYTHFRKNISRHYTSFRKTLQGWNQRKGRSTVVVILMNFVLFVIGFVIENIEKIVAVWQKLYLIRNRNSSHCTRNKLLGEFLFVRRSPIGKFLFVVGSLWDVGWESIFQLGVVESQSVLLTCNFPL